MNDNLENKIQESLKFLYCENDYIYIYKSVRINKYIYVYVFFLQFNFVVVPFNGSLVDSS